MFDNHFVKLSFILILHLSAYTMEAPTSRPKIILLGASYTHPSAYILQLELLEGLYKNQIEVLLNEEESPDKNLSELLEIAAINTQAMNEIIEIKKATAEIFSSPDLSIKDGLIVFSNKIIQQIAEIINDLNSKAIFKSELGQMIALNPEAYAINLIRCLHPYMLETHISEDIVSLFTNKFKLDLFTFMAKHKLNFGHLEKNYIEDDNDLAYQTIVIKSNDLDNPNNKKVLAVYNKYEDTRTNIMADTLFRQYQNCLNSNTIILSHIGLLHTKRIAAKLLKYGVPIENIKVIYLNANKNDLSYRFPKVFSMLESRLDTDQLIRDYLDQIHPIKIWTTYGYNHNTKAFELNKPEAWNTLIDSILNHKNTEFCDGFHCMKAKADTKLSSCPKCSQVKYCSKDCQAKHWRSHQYDCHKAKK